MRLLVAILLLSVSAIGQEGIPNKVGTGELPPGLEGVTDLHAIQQSQFDALRLCIDELQNRYERGLINISNLLAAQTDLSIARLGSTNVKQERLDFIQDALVNALKTWQRIHELHKVGSRGGEADTEAQARAAVFRYRVMWLKEKAGENSGAKPMGLSVSGQEGIPTNVGTGELPPGLAGVTDLRASRQSQIDALTQCVDLFRNRYERGLINLDNFLAAQAELAKARLDTANVKQERLDFLQEALISALRTWQRIHELQKMGSRGGEADAEAQARAAVFRYRVMWLKEKARENNEPKPIKLPASSQEGIPTNIGTGELPPGLEGIADLHLSRQSQIDALKQCVDVLRNRYERGLVNISNLGAAQTELAIARLDTTDVKQERLDFIQEALVNALMNWQRIHEMQKVVSRGGEVDAEAQARAAVFRYRVMWLKEKARENNEPEGIGQPPMSKDFVGNGGCTTPVYIPPTESLSQRLPVRFRVRMRAGWVWVCGKCWQRTRK